MWTSASARTASRNELRDMPSFAASLSSTGRRSPGRKSPETIIALIFSIASSVTLTRAPCPLDLTGGRNSMHVSDGTHTLHPAARPLIRPARDDTSDDYYTRLAVARAHPAS